MRLLVSHVPMVSVSLLHGLYEGFRANSGSHEREGERSDRNHTRNTHAGGNKATK